MKMNCHKCRKELNLMVDSFCCGRVHLYEYPDRGKVLRPRELTQEQKEAREVKRARKRGKSPGKQVIEAVKKRDGYKCTNCSGTANLQVHHIKHRKDGGSHDMENLTTLCDLCHAEEHRDETVYNVMIKKAFGIA